MDPDLIRMRDPSQSADARIKRAQRERSTDERLASIEEDNRKLRQRIASLERIVLDLDARR